MAPAQGLFFLHADYPEYTILDSSDYDNNHDHTLASEKKRKRDDDGIIDSDKRMRNDNTTSC